MKETYCHVCGTLLESKWLEGEGEIPFCPQCEQYRFTLYNVAVSMIIVNESTGKILLIKQYGRPHYILVAGYVNHGEPLEDAVKREVKEETGMSVTRLRFNRTRFFEPSDTLMCNFTAFVQDDSDLHTNREIDSYNWFSPEEALLNIKSGSLAEEFLKEFLCK